MSDLEIIETLAKCIRDKTFSLSVLPTNKHLSEYSLNEIQIAHQNENIVMTVYDEYHDTKIDNAVLWLNIILDTCIAYEEAKDYNTWLSNEGYPDNSFFRSLYQQYENIIPQVRAIIGFDLEVISYSHFELNTDTAKALRQYKL